MIASRKDVEAFLGQFQPIVAAGRCGFLDERSKNIKSMKDNGLTYTDIKQALMTLSAGDYFAGPTPDRTHPGYVWEFTMSIATDPGAVEYYVKVKVQPDGVTGLCLSFHEQEAPEVHPYRT